MKQTINVYANYSIVAETKKSTSKKLQDMKKFKNYIDYLKWKQSLFLYIQTRTTEDIEISIVLNTWIKDISTGTVWMTCGVLTKDKIERITLEREEPYLKNKIWDKQKGWTTKTEQGELEW